MLFSSQTAKGQSFSGKDFWLTLPQATSVQGKGDTNLANAFFVITGEAGTKVKFYRVHSKITDSLYISKSGMDTFRIRYATHLMPLIFKDPSPIYLKNNQLFDRSLHIISTDNVDIKTYINFPVERFSFYKKNPTAMVYPLFFGNNGSELGSSQSFSCLHTFKDQGLTFTSINGSGEYVYDLHSPEFVSTGIFIVVAGEDSTKIEITPNTGLLGGYIKGTSYQKWLKKGEIFYSGTKDSDMTGSTIKVLNCKPVNVFTGGIGTPRELIWKNKYGKSIFPWADGTSNVYAHNFMPLLPDQVHGYRYLIPFDPFGIDTMARYNYDVLDTNGVPDKHFCPGYNSWTCPPQKAWATVQCVALFDNTKVKINNRTITLSKKGDTKGDSIQDCGYVESDKPVSVVWMPGGIRGAGSHMLPAFNADTIAKDTLSLPCAWERLNTGLYRPWKAPVAWVMAPGKGKPDIWINGRIKTLQRRMKFINEEWYFDTINLKSNFHNRLYCSRGAFGIYAYEFNSQNVQNIYPFGLNTSVQWLKMKVNGLWNMRYNNPVQICQNTQATLEAITDWYKPKSIKWILPKGKSDTGTKIKYTFTDTGYFNIKIISQRNYSDCNNKFVTDTLERMVYVYSLPLLKLPADTTVCKGTQLKIAAWHTGLPNPVWNLNKAFYCYLCDSIKPTIDSNMMFEAVISKAGCPLVADTINIKLADTFQLNLTGDTILCFGQKAPFKLTYNALPKKGSVSWSIPATNDTIAFWKANKTMTIRVSARDACSDSVFKDSIKVIVHPPLKLSGLNDTSLCYSSIFNPNYATKGGNADSTLHIWWNRVKDKTPNYNARKDSVFLLVLTDGCSTPDTGKIKLTVFPILNVNWIVLKDTWCYGKSIPLSAIAIGGNPVKYDWHLLYNGTKIDSNSGKILLSNQSLFKQGIYKVTLQNTCGLLDTPLNSNFIKSILLKPQNAADTVCSSADTIRGTVNNKTAMVYLFAGGKRDSIQTSGNYQFVLKPSFTGQILVTTHDGCSLPDSATYQRRIATPLQIQKTAITEYCAPAAVNISIGTSGGIHNKIKYSISAYGKIGNGPSLAYNADSTHPVYFTCTDGCTVTKDSEMVMIIPRIMGSWHDTMGCNPLSVEIQLSKVKEKLQWKIDMGDGSAPYLVNTNNVQLQKQAHTFTKAGNYFGKIYLIAGATQCLEANIKSNVQETPIADFSYSPSSVEITAPEVQFINLSQYATGYFWSFEAGHTSTLSDPKYIFKDTGLYHIKLVAKNPVGCADSITKLLHVYGRLLVYVPNAIRPSGVNKSFSPVVFNGILEKFEVYNRWGQKLHDSALPFTPKENEPAEVLVYQAFVKDYGNKLHIFKGTFQVLK